MLCFTLKCGKRVVDGLNGIQYKWNEFPYKNGLSLIYIKSLDQNGVAPCMMSRIFFPSDQYLPYKYLSALHIQDDDNV